MSAEPAAKVRSRTKRRIYAALADHLEDVGEDVLYYRGDGSGRPVGDGEAVELSDEAMEHLLDVVVLELRRRSQPRPTVSELRKRLPSRPFRRGCVSGAGSQGRVVVFDVDGVLVDSLRAHLQICVDLAREYRLPIVVPTPDEFRALVKAGAVISPMKNFFRVVGFTDDQAERADLYYHEHFAEEYFPHMFLGAFDLVKEAAKLARLGIVTSNGVSNVKRVLGRGIGYFDADLVFTHGDGKWKTKADALRLVRDHWKVSGGDVVYVGDQPADMAAAKDAGVRFIAATYGWGLSPGDAPLVAASAHEVLYCLKHEVWK